jgi:Sec7-like guanine-nucleotide exchange factor
VRPKSSPAKLIAMKRRVDMMCDTIDDLREQWVHKQLEVEQRTRRLEAVTQLARERIDSTTCGCGRANCEQCRADAADRLVLKEVGL